MSIAPTSAIKSANVIKPIIAVNSKIYESFHAQKKETISLNPAILNAHM